MAGFSLVWDHKAKKQYNLLKRKAEASLKSRETAKRAKATKDEGLFKQVQKCIKLLAENPRHPGLQTHPFLSLQNPYNEDEKVFEAYAQQHTSGAYRIFWCYGPEKKQITIIAIIPHP
jgi:hypothetical protein